MPAVHPARMLRRTNVLLLVPLLALAPAAQAAIDPDLSYVDRSSAEYARFANWVNGALGSSNLPYGFAGADAAYMHRLTQGTLEWRADYCELAVELAEAQVAQAESEIAAGGRPDVSGDSYLHVGEMITDVALAYDWCAAHTTSAQRSRWAHYAQQAIWNVWNHDAANWSVPGGSARAFPWSGWSTDNPGNNYHYSFVTATLYWALASNDQGWIDFLDAEKRQPMADYFAALPGGGSREGTGYGASHRALFGFYALWDRATGDDLANDNGHLSDTIRYWVHATVPSMDRFAPIGDQARSSNPTIYDYHRHLVLQARQLSGDAQARSDASWWLNAISLDRMSSGFNYRHDLLTDGASGSPPAALTYYAPGTGHLFSRTAWNDRAMWLAFTAGPFMESHAHQDQGAFTLFDGDWLAVTANIASHSGIQQGTPVHNVLRFERADTSAAQCNSPGNDVVVHQCRPTQSVMQVEETGPGGAVRASADLTDAYQPANSSQARYVNLWQRDIDFRGRRLTVSDRYQVASGVQAIFQVNVPAQPMVNGNRVKAGELDIRVVEPANAQIEIVHWPSEDSDVRSGWRVDVRGGNGEYVVELSTADVIMSDSFED